MSKPIPRSATELARADALRKLVAQGKVHPLDALDLMSRPTELVRQAEQTVDRQVYRTRPGSEAAS